jgi:hypothetical protein
MTDLDTGAADVRKTQDAIAAAGIMKYFMARE